MNNKGSFYFPTVRSLLCVCVCILSQTRESETSSKDAFNAGGTTNEIITRRFSFFFTVENNPSVSTIESNPKEKEMPKMISRCVMEVIESKLFSVVFLFFIKASFQFSACKRIRSYESVSRQDAKVRALKISQ